jgi:hypothetical protein
MGEGRLENAAIRTIVKKNRRMLDMPMNNALRVLKGWHSIRKCEHVLYNPETGGPWKDLWLGLKKALQEGGNAEVTWHTLPAQQQWGRSRDSQGASRAFRR